MVSFHRIFAIALAGAVFVGCRSDSSAPSARAVGSIEGAAPVQNRILGKASRVESGVIADPVRGVILDLAGQPVSRAHVTLFQRTREWPRAGRERLQPPVWTGADGRFEFGITRRPHLELRVEAKGFATQELMPAPQVEDVVVELAPGFQVVGQVLGPDGAPCSDCAVFLESSKSGSKMRALQSRTDAQGEFEFGGVPAGELSRFRLVARHPDFRPAEINQVMVGHLRYHSLKFDNLSSLRVAGIVRSPDGELLPGCEVLVYPNNPTGLLSIPYEATSGDEGRFQVAGLAPGSYQMEVRHDEYSAERKLVSLTRGSKTGLEVALEDRATLSGRLTGLKDADGVVLSVVSELGEFGTTTLREDGSFEFAGGGFSQGPATLELAEGTACFAVSRSRWTRVRLRDDGPKLELATVPAIEFEGRVLDDAGKPIPGVQILTHLNFYRELGALKLRPRLIAVTDDTGSYRIRGMGPGEVPLGFKKERFAYVHEIARVTADRAKARAEARLRKVINLLRPGTIEGRVTSGGKPVQGVLVMVGRGANLRKTHTRKGGSYRLAGVKPGERRVRAQLGRLPIQRGALIEVEPGARVRGVDLELPSRRIRGRLVDTEGAPMPRMIVEAPSGFMAETDRDGTFEIDVPRHPARLNIRLRRGAPSTQRFLVGENDDGVIEDVTVQIAPRAELVAKIVEMPSGRPATGVLVQLEPVVTDGPDTEALAQKTEKYIPEFMKKAMKGALVGLQKAATRYARHSHRVTERWVTLDEGRLHLTNLPNKPMRLTIRAKGFAPFVDERVELKNGKPEDLKTIKLRRGARVHGRVVDAWGKPLAGARIVLGRESELANPTAKTVYETDEKGFFAVRGVVPNNRRIYIASEAFATRWHDFDLPRDQFLTRKNPVRIQMQPGATIQVRVVDDKVDQPMGYMMVILQRGGEVIARERTNEAGVATFTHLSKDHYHVFLRGHESSKLSQTVDDTSGSKVYPPLLIRFKE